MQINISNFYRHTDLSLNQKDKARSYLQALLDIRGYGGFVTQ